MKGACFRPVCVLQRSSEGEQGFLDSLPEVVLEKRQTCVPLTHTHRLSDPSVCLLQRRLQQCIQTSDYTQPQLRETRHELSTDASDILKDMHMKQIFI